MALTRLHLVVSVPYVPSSARRLRVDDGAGPRYSPSQRGGTPACLGGLGSTRRSAGHKTTAIRKWAFTAVRRGQPNPTVLGVPALRSEDAPLMGTWLPVLGYLLDLGRRTSGPGLGLALTVRGTAHVRLSPAFPAPQHNSSARSALSAFSKHTLSSRSPHSRVRSPQTTPPAPASGFSP